MFGSSGHVNRPSGGVLKNYNSCSNFTLSKSIVNTQRVLSVGASAHLFAYKDGFDSYSTHKIPVKESPHFKPEYDIMYINHYATKSLEDYMFRIKTRGSVGSPKNLEFFYKINNETIDKCDVLQFPSERKSV